LFEVVLGWLVREVDQQRVTPNDVLNPENEIVDEAEKVQVKALDSSGLECFDIF